MQRSGNYDVFISFKSEDSDLAERVYDYCQQNLKVPFWSKKTLPQLSKSEYEDAIYDAIRKSKHFVVVLSKLDYLSANWIKREMSAFDRAITEGRKQDANFVFVVTDDVYKKIIDSNKMCLDERYCGYQIIKMSNFEETLISYIV
ncbi:MAG: toll/interleukin-1 receptor domain-containing protein [Ruminococcaceae bacterium]|nr:toll/interleukin-1 receptor domain-containing protein [Oscillospiraceae bacterium]